MGQGSARARERRAHQAVPPRQRHSLKTSDARLAREKAELLVSATHRGEVEKALASLGMGGEWALGVALVNELWTKGNRALVAGATQWPAHAFDYPTSDRVLFVQACMRDNPGPHYEMLNKCSCALDKIAAAAAKHGIAAERIADLGVGQQHPLAGGGQVGVGLLVRGDVANGGDDHLLAGDVGRSQ